MPDVRRCVVITGMSGAGKSTALRILEDRGFYACDNLPPKLLMELARTLSNNSSAVETGLAVVIDHRAEDLFDGLFSSIEELKTSGIDVTVFFMDASDNWIVKRFEMTRRRHPMSKGRTITDGMIEERWLLGSVKARSTFVVDTSSMTPFELRGSLLRDLGIDDEPLSVVVSSFGFKYGIPRDCDHLFDVRFLPNPHYVPELRDLSGLDADVIRFLDKVPEKAQFVEQVSSLLDFVLTQYYRTDKKQVHIAFGCTGGRHRSVAVASEVAHALSTLGHPLSELHRDIDRDAEKEGR